MKQARNRKVHYPSLNSILDDLLKDPEYAQHLAPTFGTERTTNYVVPGKSSKKTRQR